MQALQHGDPQGAEPLRRAIADYVNLERGAKAIADRIIVLTSSQQALTLCATILMDSGSSIVIEDPAYHGARKAFEAAELNCIPVPVDGEGFPKAAIRSHRAISALRPISREPHDLPLSIFGHGVKQHPTIEDVEDGAASRADDKYIPADCDLSISSDQAEPLDIGRGIGGISTLSPINENHAEGCRHPAPLWL